MIVAFGSNSKTEILENNIDFIFDEEKALNELEEIKDNLLLFGCVKLELGYN